MTDTPRRGPRLIEDGLENLPRAEKPGRSAGD